MSRPVALVTGASRGIGKAIALKLAADGFHVAVNFISNADRARAVCEAIEAAGGSAEPLGFDIADAAAAGGAIADLGKRHGRLDALVNNAGMTIDNLVLRLTDDDWDRVMAVNLRGTFNCTKAASRVMLRARFGRIVNLTSVVGLMGNAGQSAYAAAKAGIIGFTKSVAREFAGRDITINAVAPGFIETDMVLDLPEASRSEYLKAIPAGRFGTAEEVAEAVAFLVRPTSAYITGQVIGVNGGLYM